MSEILDRVYPDNESQLFFTEIEDHRKYITELEQQLQQAHRQGWEQAKAEARVLSFSCSCGKAITGMEYKVAENDL